MLPRVAERRARFRKIVGVAVGACAAFCLVAGVASAFASPKIESAPAAPKHAVSAPVERSAPAASITPVEKLDVGERTKAPGHVVATRPAKAKRR
jgi:multidrug efflux pump subunit AcrA (membrane-fusion protein)